MAWSTFLGVVIGAYAVYYVLNFLYDLFFSRKKMPTADAGVHYEIEALDSEEEQRYDLSQKETGDNDQYEDNEQYEDDDEEGEQPYKQEELNRTAAPALRVEGQGIPLEEFLKEAKSYSSSIF